MTYQEFLAEVDDSHSMTTAREHIAEVCREAAGIDGGRIVELGSHAGISTAAIALASPQSTIVSVDLCDTVGESERVAYWKSLGVKNIRPVAGSSRDYLAGLADKVDLIFHDADHGERAVGEYLLAAGLCATLAIHDWEQLCFQSQFSICERFSSEWWSHPDARGRVLWIGSNA